MNILTIVVVLWILYFLAESWWLDHVPNWKDDPTFYYGFRPRKKL